MIKPAKVVASHGWPPEPNSEGGRYRHSSNSCFSGLRSFLKLEKARPLPSVWLGWAVACGHKRQGLMEERGRAKPFPGVARPGEAFFQSTFPIGRPEARPSRDAGPYNTFTGAQPYLLRHICSDMANPFEIFSPALARGHFVNLQQQRLSFLSQALTWALLVCSRSTCGLVAMTSASHAEGRQFDPGQVYFPLQCRKWEARWGEARQAERGLRRAAASWDQGMQGQRMALRKTWSWQDSNLQSLVPTPYPLGHRTLHAKPRKDHTECGGRAGRSRRKKKKWREGGLNPRPLPALLACLPGDHWHDAESARRQMATRCHTVGRVLAATTQVRLLVRTFISSGQSPASLHNK